MKKILKILAVIILIAVAVEGAFYGCVLNQVERCDKNSMGQRQQGYNEIFSAKTVFAQ